MNEEIKEEKTSFGIVGVYIPSEAIFNNNLTNTEKILFGFLRNLSTSKDGCTASNRYLGNMVGLSPNKVSEAVKNLKDQGYIKVSFSTKNKWTNETQRHIYEDPNYIVKYRPLIELVHGVFVSKDRTLSEYVERGYPQGEGGVTETGNNTYSNTYSLYKEKNFSSTNVEETNCRAATEGEVLTEKHKGKEWRSKKDPSISKKNNIRSLMKTKNNPSLYKIDSDPYEIINKWNDSGLMYIDPQSSKATASQLAQLMGGTYFSSRSLDNGFGKYVDHPFSKDEILSAIENRSRAAIDPEYAPIDPTKKSKIRKLPIFIWLYNPKNGQSQFLQDFEKAPRLARKKVALIEDEQPDHTEAVKEIYVKSVLHGVQPLSPWSNYDENNFREAGALLWEFFERTSSIINSYYRRDPDQKARHLINAIRANMRDEEGNIPTSWLCSDKTFMKDLPSYLGTQRIINSGSF